MRETVARLATPWDRLFGALESASNDQVALLGIEPDPKAGTVLITGDSKNYLAALSYVLNLSKAEGLGGVQLVRHEAKSNDPQRRGELLGVGGMEWDAAMRERLLRLHPGSRPARDRLRGSARGRGAVSARRSALARGPRGRGRGAARPPGAAGAQASGPAAAADKVAAVYQHLSRDETAATDWLAKLHAIGAATGLELKSAAYRTQPTEGRIVRYEIVLPIAGSYPQIRDFLTRSLAEMPAMSIDQLTLRRESRNDATLHAELRMTLHMVKS